LRKKETQKVIVREKKGGERRRVPSVGRVASFSFRKFPASRRMAGDGEKRVLPKKRNPGLRPRGSAREKKVPLRKKK